MVVGRDERLQKAALQCDRLIGIWHLEFPRSLASWIEIGGQLVQKSHRKVRRSEASAHI